MKYYSGLDVSLKETFISIVDEKGKIVKEEVVASESDAIAKCLLDQDKRYEVIGIESGQLSISMCKELRSFGLPVVCVDARHMAAALSARINKNDKNDARGIAQMMRVGLYKEVLVKSDESCQIKVALGSRRQLICSKQQIVGTIRGLLKIHGIKLGKRSKFETFALRIQETINNVDEISRSSIEALLHSLKTIEESIRKLDKILSEQGRKDEDCKLLTTVPGVGVIVAMTYKAAIDDPYRFETSYTVGAYMGLSPRQYASGEVDRHGSISKMGPMECRSMLYEAAQVLLTISRKNFKLRSWGLKLAKKKGMKKAIVAVARKLAFRKKSIELPKFAKNKVEQLESIVERWCFFFKYAEETTEEDLKEIAEKAPIIKLAYDELDKFRWNEKDLVAYEERIMDLRKEEAILEHRLDLAEEKGKKIGKEEGKIEGKIEVAKAMLANNVDVNTIVKFTGLSISEIEELSGNL
ncbi:DEDD_Tnp_IS110 domain-containing protein [Trichonephila clavata]|uniref:DEDD_Tnp_IS110 domain-containing protein n=3 Tax=cellular organisms TaxID=131567 RepID=A0A8X6GXH3_TRICU|nr:DEDD_Tnp_IS110 domain-containing protein [Trichonephila clavata]